jgi:hypothetical protein
MGTDGSPWQGGRRAWERLAAWYREGGSPPPDEHSDPLAALTDIGLVRRLLDEAELEAVRSARRHGRSWSEIAVKLGVTRQSAWERWRDLDAERTEPPGAEAELTADPDVHPKVAAALDRAARKVARRSPWVVVPNVVGMSVDEARTLLAAHGLVGVLPDPDGPSADVLGLAGAVVTDQSPEAGATAQRGAPVKLWTERGGGSGVREPRRPKPTPRTGRKYSEEPSGEAVG